MNFELNQYHRNVSNEDLLQDILRIAELLNKETLTQVEYKEHGGIFGCNTITHRFKGWSNALIACGLRASKISGKRRYNSVSKELLIKDLTKVAKNLGVSTIKSTEYEMYGIYNRNSFTNEFGSWNNALVAAGLNATGYHRNIKTVELLKEIEKMWVSLGRQPTCNDVKAGLSQYGMKTYYTHFGSWRKALEFFIAYINGNQEVEEHVSSENESNHSFALSPLKTDNQPKHQTKRDINLRMRFLVMKRDNFKCCMCGTSPAKDPSVELHIDHIIPWSKGGETTMDNLQTLCSKCNYGKSNL